MSRINEFEQLLLASVAANIQLEDVVKPEDEIEKLKDELAKCKEESNKAG
jgi:hypothetical protein